MKTFAAMTVAALAAVSANHALAQTDEPPRVAVSYADLDLSKPSGRATLEGRVRNAINRVCPGVSLRSEMTKRHAYRVCRKTAWIDARRQLASIYAGSSLAMTEARTSASPN